ncbi:MAG: sodium:solute symporter [Chitinophagales bacterium]|nr:sodium:solute symporter [Chitinophagales bacterium]
MSPIIIILCILAYLGILVIVSKIVSKDADNETYFIGNRKSPWYLLAFGLIAESLSGVTFISVPGAVGTSYFSYLQLVLGYFFGYMVISYILLPIYYRMQLTSIYVYLRERFGTTSQRTGSFFFLLSRLFGAAARLYLAAIVLQTFLFDQLGIPFWVSVSIIIALMLAYTIKGGIRALVYTDIIQAAFLLLGVILTILFVIKDLNLGILEMIKVIYESDYSTTFFWNINESNYFWKQLLGGMFIAIAMTGLDQNMMQKSLSCPNLKDAQKNMNSFSVIVIFVNLLFLALGALLYMFSEKHHINIPTMTDQLYPILAFEHLGIWAGLVFTIGLSAASFSSADSVLTALTTSFYIDFLKKEGDDESALHKKRYILHIFFAVLLLLIILGIKSMNNMAVIDLVFLLAGYTYGPLLGLFFVGIFTKVSLREKWVPIVALLTPFIGHTIKTFLYQPALTNIMIEGKSNFYTHFLYHIGQWFTQLTHLPLEYKIGNELILINGIIATLFLLLISKKEKV